METNIIYRRAEASDIPQLVDIRIDFTSELDGSIAVDTNNKLRQSTFDYLNRFLNQQYFVWVACDGNQIISTAAFVIRTQPGSPKNISGIWAYVMFVYTRPENRRKGYSKHIMSQLLAYAKNMNIHGIELHATKMGAPGYEKMGFIPQPQPTYRMYI